MAMELLQAPAAACHGQCYGFEAERDMWEPPRLAVRSDASARSGFDTMSASEYLDSPATLRAKVQALAMLLRRSSNCVVYSGAGLSTSAGIGDYASQSSQTLSRPDLAPTSPFCAQPTLAHRVLVALQQAGLLKYWINQNHDGLPQKAGLPQECINEIHGAWHAPDNPVIKMSGRLRPDLVEDLAAWEQRADLVLALGTSLCGMTADCVVTTAAAKAPAAGLGSIIVGLQRTVQDQNCSLRVFSTCDEVFQLLAQELDLHVAPPISFMPPALAGEQEVFGVAYDASGRRDPGCLMDLDLRDDALVVITGGQHAGAQGEIVGRDREGNVRCRFRLRPERGNLRAYVAMLFGRWWIQAAVDQTVPILPLVNLPFDEDQCIAARKLRQLISDYGA